MDLSTMAFMMILSLAPASRRSAPPTWSETDDAYLARMSSIADDIASVGRNRTEVAALVGVAIHESAAAPDVDAGSCYRDGSWHSRCDGGRAVSLWQLQDADHEKRETYRTDRKAAAREALRRILSSMNRCRANDPHERLAGLASGSCARGLDAARGLDTFIRRALDVPGT